MILYLYVCFDDGFTNQRRTKECPEGHEKMAARDTGQVE